LKKQKKIKNQDKNHKIIKTGAGIIKMLQLIKKKMKI